MKLVFAFLLTAVLTTVVCACAVSPRSIVNEENAVAEITLFAYDGKNDSKTGLMNLGHAFVMVENLTDERLDVGAYTLDSGERVTIGTWGISGHNGVWYNIEAKYIRDLSRYVGRVSVCKSVSAESLKKINEYIAANDRWNAFYNCSAFASNLFDEIAANSEKTGGVTTPNELSEIIRAFDKWEQDAEVTSEFDKIGYYDGRRFVECSVTA